MFFFPLQELHKNIVNQYKKYYKLNPPVLSQEDCMYWYNFLAYHMAGANMQQVGSGRCPLLPSFTHSYLCFSLQAFSLLSLSSPKLKSSWVNTQHRVFRRSSDNHCPLWKLLYFYPLYLVFSTSSWEDFLFYTIMACVFLFLFKKF